MATDSMMPLITADALQAQSTELDAGYRQGMELLAASTRTALSAAQALGGVSLAFWQCRLKSGLETTARLAECRAPEDLLEIQLDHASATVQAYADHLGRVGAIVGRATLTELPATSRALVPVPAPGELAA